MLWFAQGSATLFSPVAELRGYDRQAAEELKQRKTHVEERKPLDASPAANRAAGLSVSSHVVIRCTEAKGDFATGHASIPIPQFSRCLWRSRRSCCENWKA